jgi:hypothetical protein
MFRIDRYVSFAMWAIIAISFPIMLMLLSNRSPDLLWPYLVALCLLWLAPALSLGTLDGGPGPHSPWFYRFAVLAAVWVAGVAAYGITVLVD